MHVQRDLKLVMCTGAVRLEHSKCTCYSSSSCCFVQQFHLHRRGYHALRNLEYRNLLALSCPKVPTYTTSNNNWQHTLPVKNAARLSKTPPATPENGQLEHMHNPSRHRGHCSVARLHFNHMCKWPTLQHTTGGEKPYWDKGAQQP
jgi:hypothetical protein